jgi:hypothetical protein
LTKRFGEEVVGKQQFSGSSCEEQVASLADHDRWKGVIKSLMGAGEAEEVNKRF